MTNFNKDTNILFEMIPGFINIDGKLYNFHMSKGRRITISYQTDWDSQQNASYLGETNRSSDKSLHDVCEKTIKWLFEGDYVKYMPFGFKKKYEELYGVTIVHSRGFEE
jgi:hypothetical protein